MIKPSIKKIITTLPKKPGVYFLKDKKEHILYIGKAKNIHARVLSHFSKQGGSSFNFYSKVAGIDFIPTKTEKDALVLEMRLVKEHQPFYNVELKDDKNFFFVSFSDEEFPRVSLIHQPSKKDSIIGPFVSGKEIKDYMKLLRRIFPYRTCRNKKDNPCLYYHMGLCGAHGVRAKQYSLVIGGLKVFLELLATQKVSIEGYDVSNTQGTLSVGSLVSFVGKRPQKALYKRFKIKSVSGSNDTASLREIIDRRLAHNDWALPHLFLIDGSVGHLSKLAHCPIPVVGISKRFLVGGRRRRTSLLGFVRSPYGRGAVPIEKLPSSVAHILLAVRDEAHRFAITYHRKRRGKEFIDKRKRG